MACISEDNIHMGFIYSIFFCHEANLTIEVDGAVHLGSKEYDEERTQYLESSGLRVIRFRNEEIEENIDKVIVPIYVCLNHES